VPLPLRKWLTLTGVAIGGTCLYGASLSLVLPSWNLLTAAVWLAVSAGAAWGVFIPLLHGITRVPFLTCFDACLTTMAGGEVVLMSGALVNGLLCELHVTAHALWINAAIVAISNLAMLAILARLLWRRRVPPRITAALWMLILNGSGAIAFAALYPLLHGR
jgi:hypothetical protein